MNDSNIILTVNGKSFSMSTRKLTQEEIDNIECYCQCFFDEDDPVVPIEEALGMSPYKLCEIATDEIKKHYGIELVPTRIDAEFSIDINN